MQKGTIWGAWLACFASMLIAEDWPQFRGPNASGVASNSHLPVTFGPDSNLSWKISSPLGHSSPVIVGKTIYLTGFQNDSLITLAYERDPAASSGSAQSHELAIAVATISTMRLLPHPQQMGME